MALESHPFAYLIELYFPPDQWELAACISFQECSWQPLCVPAMGVPCTPTWCPPPGGCYPDRCVQGPPLPVPLMGPAVGGRAFGIFGLAEAEWDPAQNPQSPFTAAEWAAVMDPNLNTWMASVVWEQNGWRAWTTCQACNACGVMGGPIPYPRHPVSPPSAGGGLLLAGLFVGAAVGIVALEVAEHAVAHRLVS